jgi:hypothetical protein
MSQSTASLAVEMEPCSDARTPQPIEGWLATLIPDKNLGLGNDAKPQFHAISPTPLLTGHYFHVLEVRDDRLQRLQTTRRHALAGAGWKKQKSTDTQQYASNPSMCRSRHSRITRPLWIRTNGHPLTGTRLERNMPCRERLGRQLSLAFSSKDKNCCDPFWSTQKLPPSIGLLGCPLRQPLLRTRSRASKGYNTSQVKLIVNEEAFSTPFFSEDVKEALDQICSGVGSCSGSHRERQADEEQVDNPATFPKQDRPGTKRRLSRGTTQRELNECNDNGDGDDQEPKKRRLPPCNGEDDYSKRYACPFYKHNPSKYRNGSCGGPGWISVSRVKEHIYRRHGPPKFQCRRCLEAFPGESAFEDHIHQTTGCVTRTPNEKPEVISKSQLEKLKKRGKKAATEPERWSEVFRIIFPATTEDEIPSPYYDTRGDKFTLSNSLDSERLRRLLAEELPKRVGEEVARHLPRDAPIVDTLTRIVRQVVQDAFDSYKSGSTGMQRPPDPGIPHHGARTPSPEAAASPTSVALNQDYSWSSVNRGTNLDSSCDGDYYWISDNPTPSDSCVHQEASVGRGPPMTPIVPSRLNCIVTAENINALPELASFVDYSWPTPVQTSSRQSGLSGNQEAQSVPEFQDDPHSILE